VRNAFSLHDEYFSYYINLRMNPRSSFRLAHWSLPPEGYLKLNVDGSFLKALGA